jgi:hypothetical protein
MGNLELERKKNFWMKNYFFKYFSSKLQNLSILFNLLEKYPL